MNVDEIIILFKQNNYYLKSSQLVNCKVHTSFIREMLEQGQIEQVKRGLYRLPVEALPEHKIFTYDYIDAAIAVPKGIFCLTTALYYHGLSTQKPSVLDMAIPRTHRTPRLFTVSVRFYRFSTLYYAYGVNEIEAGLATIKFYEKEKAVCDAVRMRRIIGEDVAMESLNLYLRQGRNNINKLLKTAKFCRVKHIIEPAVKAMVGF